MKRLIITLALTLGPWFATCRGQQIIEQPKWNWTYNLNFAPPIGQSFTATEANLSAIGFRLENAAAWPATVTYQLYAGEGTSGSLLWSSSFELGAGPAGFYDCDFSSVRLTLGQTYTAMISTPSDYCNISLEQWVTESGQPLAGMADYAGGHAILRGEPSSMFDLTFRVQAIPEPQTAGLVLLGAGLFLVQRRGMSGSRRQG